MKKTSSRSSRAKPNSQGRGKLANIDDTIYTITDTNFEDLPVRNTANGWWLSRTKVESLINAFKMDCTIEEACSLAGISNRQYKHFLEVHPNFCDVVAACRLIPTYTARMEVVTGIAGDKEFALKYLERKKKDEFGKVDTMANTQVNLQVPILLDTRINAGNNRREGE